MLNKIPTYTLMDLSEEVQEYNEWEEAQIDRDISVEELEKEALKLFPKRFIAVGDLKKYYQPHLNEIIIPMEDLKATLSETK